MGRKLLWAILSAVMMGSCANNEEIGERVTLPATGGRTPISVTTYLPGVTRAANVATLTSLGTDGGGFSLLAQYEDDGETISVIDGTYVADANGNCANVDGGMAYWPEKKDATVDFFAIYPVDAIGQKSIVAFYDEKVFNVSANGTDDYLVAYTAATSTANSGAVTLTFNHVLAQVQLNVKTSDETFQYTLLSAELKTPATAEYDCVRETVTAIAGDSTAHRLGSADGASVVVGTTLANVGSAMVSSSNGEGSVCKLTLSYRTSLNGQTRDYTKTANVTIVAGYLNNINATVAGDTPLTLYVDAVDEWVEGEPQNIGWNDSGSNSDAHEYVDLGLSVKWATCNLGANSPEEYGDYFAWGETEPKDTYNDDWSNYKFTTDGGSTFTKYTGSDKYVLDPEDDAATANLGGEWRTPTKEELGELLSEDNCVWEWQAEGNTEFNGVAGYKVTSKKEGYTDNSIFLPASGYRYGTWLYDAGSFGYFWSATLSSGNVQLAYYLYFYSGFQDWDGNDRYRGFAVRPVCP